MALKKGWRLLLISVVLFSAGCSRFCSKKGPGTKPGEQQEKVVVTPNYNGITVTHVVTREMQAGKGKEVADNSTVKVKYTEWVYDPAALANQGPKIYETKDTPIEIKIGAGKVIKGLEQGLKGMRKGGKRQLIIPAEEAYGDQGQAPKIPPKAMVMIDVELIDVQ
ncbi:MAG: FKBP-type peptidyl-prolyl cis-trans isomerase [Bdellovibrionales bacterium]